MNKHIFFQKELLKWYIHHGRQDLPWQHQSPYHVWLSEIMLQQTQVSTVIDYYERFTKNFPNIFKLAEAHINDVLTMWAGLGYYHRAKNLHRSAQILVQEYHGELPKNFELLKKLPGIGPSTAAAILSQAYHLPYAILDGNVKRVLARFFGIKTSIVDTPTIKILQEIANQCMPAVECQAYTQAIMDMGAICCKPKNPHCNICPLQKACYAFQNQKVDEIPQKNKILKRKNHRFNFTAFINENNELLLVQRPDKGIWPQLWCLPSGDASEEPLVQCFHDLTHIRMDIHVYLKKLSSKNIEHQGVWINLHEPIGYGLPKPIKELITKISLVLKSKEPIQHQLDPS